MTDEISIQALLDGLNDFGNDLQKITDHFREVTEKARSSCEVLRSPERTAKVEKLELKNVNSPVYKCLNCGQYFHDRSWARPVNYCPLCGAKLEWK